MPGPKVRFADAILALRDKEVASEEENARFELFAKLVRVRAEWESEHVGSRRDVRGRRKLFVKKHCRKMRDDFFKFYFGLCGVGPRASASQNMWLMALRQARQICVEKNIPTVLATGSELHRLAKEILSEMKKPESP
jgi:hypothetical protein